MAAHPPATTLLFIGNDSGGNFVRFIDNPEAQLCAFRSEMGLAPSTRVAAVGSSVPNFTLPGGRDSNPTPARFLSPGYAILWDACETFP
jgi:hypothetical protein